MKTFKTLLTLLLLGFTLTATTSCSNTIDGAGDDIEDAGDAIQDATN